MERYIYKTLQYNISVIYIPTSQNVLNSKIFNVFFKEVTSVHRACIYLILDKAKAVIL